MGHHLPDDCHGHRNADARHGIPMVSDPCRTWCVRRRATLYRAGHLMSDSQFEMQGKEVNERTYGAGAVAIRLVALGILGIIGVVVWTFFIP